MIPKHTYCADLIRTQDPDRFLISLFAPKSAQPALWALFALNHEIAKTREVVTETALGLARLQWWRERIGDIYTQNTIAENPILESLHAAIKRYDLPRENFDHLIYAHEFDLEDVLPANLDGVMHYLDYTQTPLMQLAVQITGDDPEYEPTQPVAVNYGLARLIRGVPFYARQRRCQLPEDLMKAHKVTLTKLYDFLEPAEGLREVVKVMSELFVPRIKPHSPLLRATQALARIHMQDIKKHQHNPFAPGLARLPLFKEWRVFWGSLV